MIQYHWHFCYPHFFIARFVVPVYTLRMYTKIARIVFLFSFIVVLGSFFFARPSQTAQAQDITFSGYGWSSLIGWMQVQGPIYGVKATASGTTRINLSGYAWTSTLGWISFEASSVTDCDIDKQSGATSCTPYIDMTGNGPYRVRGFARACAVFVSGCSGELKNDRERGGWDGYISLNSGDGAWGWQLSADKTRITGYAWGDSVVGWLSINGACSGCDISVAPNDSFTVAGCASSPSYIPTFSWSTDPAAQSCTLISPNGNSRITTNSASQTNFTPVGANFVAPATGVGNYVLECTRGGVTAKVGDINVARCSPPPTEDFCPGQTFTASQAGGSCMCPDGTTAKTSASGTNCSPFGFCPAPNQTVPKVDAAGSNCSGAGKKPIIREI